MKYQAVNNDVIRRLGDDAFIPVDPGNAAYQEYQAWLTAGNTPAPAPANPAARSLSAKDRLVAMGFDLDELRVALTAGTI